MQPHQKNKRTGLVLLSIAAVFFIGIVLRKWFEPSLVQLLGG